MIMLCFSDHRSLYKFSSHKSARPAKCWKGSPLRPGVPLVFDQEDAVMLSLWVTLRRVGYAGHPCLVCVSPGPGM